MGQSTWKSTKECIGIRAQQRNPINKQLPRRKRQVAGEAERKIWVAEGFTLFFFSFLFFIFFSLFSFSVSVVTEEIILIFLYFVLFSRSGCYRFEQKLNAEFNSFQITTWNV